MKTAKGSLRMERRQILPQVTPRVRVPGNDSFGGGIINYPPLFFLK